MNVTLAAVPLNLCDRPTITALCASLVGDVECLWPLAYQDGRWQHVNHHAPQRRHCDEPQPMECDHKQCRRPAVWGAWCATGPNRCCGCCWERAEMRRS